LQKLTGREANVSVEVAEYKPIFVSGYVTRAGSFPWRPGYTVLHAETLSGGVYRPTSATGAALPSDSEKARAHRAASDLANVEVTIARLNAERSGSKEIERPARLKDLVSDVEADRLLAAQGTAMASRKAAHEAQTQGIDRARQLAQEEYEELRTQHVRLQQQLQARQDNLTKLDGLKEKGYLRAERILDEQARVADLEARVSNSSVALARIKSMLGTFQRDIDVLRQDRIAQIDAETIKQEREASQLEIEVQSAAQSYRKLTGINAFNESQSSKQSMVGYEIVRQKEGQPVAVAANRFTLLEPGDVLVVSLVDQFNN
jgi:protein involved in polysaccharide export with SLBB domain